MSTIHYQMAYCVQNHSLDISILENTYDAIFLTIDTDRKSYCALVPKQMPKEQLEELILKKWYTAYEQIQTTTTMLLHYNIQIQSFCGLPVVDYQSLMSLLLHPLLQSNIELTRNSTAIVYFARRYYKNQREF